MLTDEAVQALATAAIEYQSRYVTNNELESLKNQLADVNRSRNNLVNAIEAGIFSATTQSRLAELINISRTHMSRIETADCAVSLDVVFDICDALDVQPASLFDFR